MIQVISTDALINDDLYDIFLHNFISSIKSKNKF